MDTLWAQKGHFVAQKGRFAAPKGRFAAPKGRFAAPRATAGHCDSQHVVKKPTKVRPVQGASITPT